MIPVIAIRPEPGCAATVAAGRELSVPVQGYPLFEIAPLAWDAPDPAGFDALLIGSANAVRHGGPQLARYAGKPAYAVGAATARACEEVGLDLVATGTGGLAWVLSEVKPPHRRLLRLAGRERVEVAPPSGVTVVERTVYQAFARPLPQPVIRLLEGPAVVLLHSAEAARHFAAECARRGIERRGIALAAIGPRVSEAAGAGWAAVASAPQPTDHALLELARQLCQDRR